MLYFPNNLIECVIKLINKSDQKDGVEEHTV